MGSGKWFHQCFEMIHYGRAESVIETVVCNALGHIILPFGDRKLYALVFECLGA